MPRKRRLMLVKIVIRKEIPVLAADYQEACKIAYRGDKSVEIESVNRLDSYDDLPENMSKEDFVYTVSDDLDMLHIEDLLPRKHQ